MLEAIGTGLMLWLRNIPLFNSLVLTVWLPGNIAINYVAAKFPIETITWYDFWLPIGIELIFGPLCLGAVIYALDRRWQDRQVGYVESMRVGIRNWIRMFIATLVANILIGIGCILFLIPGIILALRFSLLGMTVILEGRSGEAARSRSSDLMRGRMWAVLGIVVVSYSLILATVGALYVPLDIVYESTTMTDFQYYAVATGLDSALDLLDVPVLAILFCVYARASGRQRDQETPDKEIESIAAPVPFLDDGNPYLPPRTS